MENKFDKLMRLVEETTKDVIDKVEDVVKGDISFSKKEDWVKSYILKNYTLEDVEKIFEEDSRRYAYLITFLNSDGEDREFLESKVLLNRKYEEGIYSEYGKDREVIYVEPINYSEEDLEDFHFNVDNSEYNVIVSYNGMFNLSKYFINTTKKKVKKTIDKINQENMAEEMIGIYKSLEVLKDFLQVNKEKTIEYYISTLPNIQEERKESEEHEDIED